jgi:hypothetical protein
MSDYIKDFLAALGLLAAALLTINRLTDFTVAGSNVWMTVTEIAIIIVCIGIIAILIPRIRLAVRERPSQLAIMSIIAFVIALLGTNLLGNFIDDFEIDAFIITAQE